MKFGWPRHSGKWLFGVILLIVLVLVGKPLLFPPPVEYMTVPVARGDIRETVLATGKLEGFRQVNVGAQVSGQLKKLHAALGESVKKGQLLAEIDPKLQQNDLQDAEAALDNVRAQKRAKQALLRQYQLAYQRQLAMRRDDASAQSDLEQAEASLEQTRADLQALEAQIRQAVIKVDTAKANLGYTRIVAPMDGVVIAIVTEEGQTVVSAQSAPTILKLADLDTMTVKAEISEADVIRVKPGLKAEFSVLGAPNEVFHSTLRAIEPAPESESTDSSSTSSTSTTSTAIYYNGLFDIANPEHKLRVSMTAQVTVVLGESQQTLMIPLSVLGRELGPDRYEVQVLSKGQPERREVKTGRKDSVNIEILDGLAEGEAVLVGDSVTAEASAEQQDRRPGPPPRG
ncbi:macrolide transporter subunit MacA [Pseudaeromonas sharmana]|uniref:Macrolide transporter subunit MacA n=1 Tax=Pseudaeromonas sharmana TaxID=328412 RepID=A0ABV8CQ18_9GAMM